MRGDHLVLGLVLSAGAGVATFFTLVSDRALHLGEQTHSPLWVGLPIAAVLAVVGLLQLRVGIVDLLVERRGIGTVAVVREVSPTGTLVNGTRVYRLRLDVLRGDGGPSAGVARAPIDPLTAWQLHPGTRMNVRYLPRHITRVHVCGLGVTGVVHPHAAGGPSPSRFA